MRLCLSWLDKLDDDVVQLAAVASFGAQIADTVDGAEDGLGTQALASELVKNRKVDAENVRVGAVGQPAQKVFLARPSKWTMTFRLQTRRNFN